MVATRGQNSHPGPSAADDDRRATNTNMKTNTNAGIESYPSGSSHGRAPWPPKPSTRAATNETPAGPALSVVVDGSEAAFSHREAEGGWSAMGPLLAIQVGRSGACHVLGVPVLCSYSAHVLRTVRGCFFRRGRSVTGMHKSAFGMFGSVSSPPTRESVTV